MMYPFAWRMSAMFALPALLLATACQPADEADEVDEAGDVAAEVEFDANAMAAEYEAHYNQHHAGVVAGYWAEDALAMYADGTFARGPEAIEAYLVAQFANNPTVDINTVDQMVFGDMAMAIGTWSVNAAPEGAEPMEMSGSWMGGYRLEDGDWKIVRLITNFDREMSAEFLGGMPAAELPPENSTMGDFLQAYEAALASGEAEAVAALYADDFWAAHVTLPAITDADDHLTALEGFAGGTAVIHGVETWDLGDGYAADGGWYEITPPGGEAIRGHYAVLAHTEDGETKIKWLIANGRPVSMIPSADAM